MSWGSSAVEHRNGFAEGGGSNPTPQHRLILSGHQPCYLPSIHLFSKIALSDHFMFVGHCDYEPRSWHSRNHIRGNKDRVIVLSVPVVHKSGPSINEKLIDGYRWKDHQLKTIEYTYAKRPYFWEYYSPLREVLLGSQATLGALNIDLIRLLCEQLDIKTELHYSEHYDIQGHKTAMLVEMCDRLKATDYLSSDGERDYVEPQEMNGYAHHYIKFEHPVYDQGHKTFMPNLSVIDLLFNVGPGAAKLVHEAGNL